MSPRAHPLVLEFVSASEPWLPAWTWFGSIFENAPLSTVGGSPTVIALVFLSLVLATLLSVYLALRLYRGYRAGGGRAMLLLGVGLVLLTTVPMVLRLALSNVGSVEVVWQETIVTACQLLGLVVILGVIHGRR